MLRSRRGFTLVELIVVIVIVFLVLALILPTIQTTRCGGGGRTQCLNNIRQLTMALISFDAAHNRLPNSGTWASELDVTGTLIGGQNFPGGVDDPTTNDIRWDYPLHNWVVDILPYIERSDIADAWKAAELKNDGSGTLALFDEPDRSSGSPRWDKASSTHYALSQIYLGLLICPNDNPNTAKGNLSYAVNGGPVIFWQNPVANNTGAAPLRFSDSGLASPAYDSIDDRTAAKNLGLLYPGSLKQNTPWDVRRSLSRVPDGTATTIMLGENLKTGYIASYPAESDPPLHTFGIGTAAAPHFGQPGSGLIEGTWANPHPLFAAFHMSDDFCDPTGKCNIGESVTVNSGDQRFTVQRADWARANSLDARDNAQQLPESFNGAIFADKGWTYLNSLHPGGVTVAMCDGSARFISNDIDGTVFAKLMSPGGTRAMNEFWPVHQQSLLDSEF
jgi:prepilin-type N-terminal cleavage/methylation domain-containing protein/prepilin-type processing-associated H-X9-DG protein